MNTYFVEELLLTRTGEIPEDFKFFISNGNVIMALFMWNRTLAESYQVPPSVVLDECGQIIGVHKSVTEVRPPPSAALFKKLAQSAIEIYQALNLTCLIRVDMFLINDVPYFGELQLFFGTDWMSEMREGKTNFEQRFIKGTNSAKL